MKKYLFFAAIMLIVSCGKHKADDPLAESGRTQRTENLLQNMIRQSAQGYMFGHQDSPVYGLSLIHI